MLDGAPASILHAVSCGTPLGPASLFRPLDPYPNVARVRRAARPLWLVHGQ